MGDLRNPKGKREHSNLDREKVSRHRLIFIAPAPWADQHAVYSLRVHFHDLETKTEQVEGLGNTGNVAKLVMTRPARV